MSPASSSPPHESTGSFERTLFKLLPIAGVSALGLGLYGFFPPGTDDLLSRAHKAIFLTLQLFVLNVGLGDMGNWQTKVASLLAPAATIGTAVLAWRMSILRFAGVWRLALAPADEVFVGGGHLAAAILANRPRTRGGNTLRVALLDPAASTPLARVLEDAGSTLRSFVVQGDGRSDRDLRKINAIGARAVWVLASDDLVNLDIVHELVRGIRAAANRGSTRRPERILVCMRDAAVVRARLEMRPLQALDVRIDYFDVARIAARQLLVEFPPESFPGDDPEQPLLHLCVVGRGDLSAELLVHAATHFVYSDQPTRAVRVTLIGPDAQATLRRIYRHHPALDPAGIVDGQLAPMLPLAHFTALDIDPSRLTPMQWSRAQDGGRAPFASIYVTTDDDTLTFAAVRRVLAVEDACKASIRPTFQVVACLNDRAGDAARPAGRWPPRVALFDIFAHCFGREDEDYPAASADPRAKRVNDAHNHQPWDKLSDRFRWSSRFSADHMDVKLAMLRQMNPHADLPRDLRACLQDAEVISWLSRLEHRRFVVERLIDGWLPIAKRKEPFEDVPSGLPYDGQGDEWTQKKFLDLNHTLVPLVEDLDTETAAIDSSIVKTMIDCFEAETPPPRP